VSRITYSDGKTMEPKAYHLDDHIFELREAITNDIVALSALLGRLRVLEVHALAGEADAVEQAEAAMEEIWSPVDEDQIDEIERMLDTVEDLVEAKRCDEVNLTVNADAIDTTVRDLVLPYLTPDDGTNHVTVKTYAIPSGREIEKARITLNRLGRYVDLTIRPTPRAIPVTPPPPGTTVEKAYAKAVELKGEAAAKQILTAVQSVEKDLEKQAAMLWKAVGA